MLIWRLAWRNLWRQPRRTLIVTGAVAVGIGGVFLAMAVNFGMLVQMVESAIAIELGHLQIHAAGFERSPGIGKRLAGGAPQAVAALERADAALAWAHPLTWAVGFLAVPVTSLTPVIGAGYVTAFVQTWLRPPKVRELRAASSDAGSALGWWRNRLLRIFLVFVFTTLGSLLGTWVGGAEIVSNLFRGG